MADKGKHDRRGRCYFCPELTRHIQSKTCYWDWLIAAGNQENTAEYENAWLFGANMSICVIFNPHAGRRRARRRTERFRRRWQGRVEFRQTEYSGHGIVLAREAAERGCRIVAAAGGDGTAHDVANGVLQADRPDVTLAVVPVGSANDYAYAVSQEFGVSQLNDDRGHLVDAGVVRFGDNQQRYFVESVGTGLSGYATMESRKISRLQGKLLYGLAVWRALRRPLVELNIQYDDRPAFQSPTLLLSAMLGCREGNFMLAPGAELADGLFDVIHGAQIHRWQAVGLLGRIGCCGLPRQHPEIHRSQCRLLRLEGQTPLVIHADGELVCVPDDAVCQAVVEILPARLRVKVCGTH